MKKLFKGLMHEQKPEPQDYEALMQKIEASLSSLSAQVEKLRVRYQAMNSKSREYFEKCVNALVTNDVERAKMFADEIAEIRRLADIVARCSLVLEQVKIRLETIVELREVIGLMVPFVSVIEAVGKEVSAIVPEASHNLRELVETIEDFVSASSYVGLKAPEESEASAEALLVLEEARKHAAELVKRNFPDVPSLNEEERLVYSYIMKGSGELDLSRCAEELGLDRKQLECVLRSLQEKGLIELQMAETT